MDTVFIANQLTVKLLTDIYALKLYFGIEF